MGRKIQSGNTNIFCHDVQNGGLSLAAHDIRVLHFIVAGRLPRGMKLPNGDIFPEMTLKDLWYIMGKDNPPVTGNTAQISGREYQGGSPGQLS